MELAADRVTAVRLTADRKSGALKLAAVVSRPVPEGAIEVSLTKPNILDEKAVWSVVAETLHKLAPKDQRISVLLPTTWRGWRFSASPPCRRRAASSPTWCVSACRSRCR